MVAPHFHGLYSSLELCCEVHDSQAYRKIDVTIERIRHILELKEILLSFQTGFSLVNAAAGRVERIMTDTLEDH